MSILAYRTTLSKCTARNVGFILLHGLDSSSDTFSNISEELSKKYNVYSIDLRGHGRSPDIGNEVTLVLYSMLLATTNRIIQESTLNDVQATIDHIGMDRFMLLGHSMGTRVAIPLSLRLGSRLLGLILEDLDLLPRTRVELPNTIYRMKSFQQIQPNLDAVFAECEKHDISRDRVQHWITSGRVFPIEGGFKIGIHPYVSYLETKALLGTSAARNDFPNISCPTLLMVAGHMSACSEEGVAEMISLLPHLQVARFPTADHSIHRTAEREFMESVWRFSEQCEEDSSRVL